MNQECVCAVCKCDRAQCTRNGSMGATPVKLHGEPLVICILFILRKNKRDKTQRPRESEKCAVGGYFSVSLSFSPCLFVRLYSTWHEDEWIFVVVNWWDGWRGDTSVSRHIVAKHSEYECAFACCFVVLDLLCLVSCAM